MEKTMERMILRIINRQQNYWDIPLCLESIILQKRMEGYLNEKDYKTCVRSFTNNNGSNCIDEDK